MTTSDPVVFALASPSAAGGAVISLTDALLLLCLAGLLVAVYQLNRLLRQLEGIERKLATGVPRQELGLPAGPAVSRAPAVAANEELPPHILAAIAAACHVQLGANARIVSITSGSDTKQVWSLEGRRQIFASHQVR